MDRSVSRTVGTGDDVRGRLQLAGQLFNKIFSYYLKILI